MSVLMPSRRRLLQMAGVTALAPALSAAKRSDVRGRVLAVSDMHSAYERTARLLAAFEAEVRSNPVPHVIAINGDIFEHGNVVSVRSGGVVDWAFLAELPSLAPAVVNLGNHDNDLTPDLAEVVTRLKGLGLHVVSTIRDTRTGAGYADPAVNLPFGAGALRVIGMATNSLSTYPKVSREQLDIPAAEVWADEELADRLSGSDINLVMSHAGVAADRQILPLLPDGSLMIGGHNHLLFQHRQGRSAYAHTGSWTNSYTVAEFHADGTVSAEPRAIASDAPASPRLEALVAATLGQHLTEEERFVMGSGPRALSLGDTGRCVAMGMAVAAGADAGFIGHTTLGTGLPAGPVNRYIFDSIVRFDGKLMVAEVPRSQFDGFMSRANQDRPMPLSERSGDFLYAAGRVETNSVVRIATTDWCATNQSEYFGTTDLHFETALGGVKAAAEAALFI